MNHELPDVQAGCRKGRGTTDQIANIRWIIEKARESKMQSWMQSQKWHNDLCSFPRQTIQYHSNPSLCPTSNTEEAAVEQFYEDLQDILELTPQKICPFHYRELECKNRKSRNTWRNRQIWPCSTEWSRAKANRVLPREHTSRSKHLFQQHKRRLYTWTSPYD